MASRPSQPRVTTNPPRSPSRSLLPPTTSSTPVGGRLVNYYAEWLSLDLSMWHHKILTSGLTLSFIRLPPVTSTPRAVQLPGDPTRRQILLDEVAALLDKNALERVDQSDPGFFSHLFTVPKKSGGFRPVIDLKRLNQHIRCPHFKMETDRSIRAQLEVGEWTTSVDFTDAYLHIMVDPGHRKFFRMNILGESFQFRSMCFGLNIAPRVFTKLLEPVASHLRSRGIHLHRYLDDWLFRGATPEIVTEHTSIALQLFQRLGLIVNYKKSDLTPRQQFIFLGMDFDLEVGLVRPTQAEVQKICGLVHLLFRMKSAPVRLLLSLLGLLNHACQFVSLGRLHIRPLQFYVKAKTPDLQKAIKQSESIPLENPFFLALEWWLNQDRLRAGVPTRPPAPVMTLSTDASLEGWGAFLEGHRASGVWKIQEQALHITILELRAVRMAVQAFVHLIAGKAIQLLSDNTTAIAYIRNQGGTQSVSLFREAKEVLEWCSAHQIILHPFYLPGHLNSLADLLSRRSQVLGTEWTLHPAIFRRIHLLVPQLSVDLFATRLNTQLPRFVSPCPDPQAWQIDAFSMDWDDLTAYAYPPTKLIPEVLRKLRRSTMRLYLVAPLWTNQAWYPEVLDLLFDLPLELPPWKRMLKQPMTEVYHHSPGLMSLHVWPLSGITSDRQAFQWRLPDMQQHHNGNHLYACINLTGGPSPVGVRRGMLIRPLLLFRS